MLPYKEWMDYVIKDEKGFWAQNNDGSLVGLTDEAPDSVKKDFEEYNEEQRREWAKPGFITRA